MPTRPGLAAFRGQLLDQIGGIEDKADGLAFLRILEFLGGFQIEELLCGVDDPEELEILVVGDGDSQLEVAVFVLEQLGTLQLRFRVIDIEGVALIVVHVRADATAADGEGVLTLGRPVARIIAAVRTGQAAVPAFCTRVAVA